MLSSQRVDCCSEWGHSEAILNKDTADLRKYFTLNSLCGKCMLLRLRGTLNGDLWRCVVFIVKVCLGWRKYKARWAVCIRQCIWLQPPAFPGQQSQHYKLRNGDKRALSCSPWRINPAIALDIGNKRPLRISFSQACCFPQSDNI